MVLVCRVGLLYTSITVFLHVVHVIFHHVEPSLLKLGGGGCQPAAYTMYPNLNLPAYTNLPPVEPLLTQELQGPSSLRTSSVPREHYVGKVSPEKQTAVVVES